MRYFPICPSIWHGLRCTPGNRLFGLFEHTACSVALAGFTQMENGSPLPLPGHAPSQGRLGSCMEPTYLPKKTVVDGRQTKSGTRRPEDPVGDLIFANCVPNPMSPDCRLLGHTKSAWCSANALLPTPAAFALFCFLFFFLKDKKLVEWTCLIGHLGKAFLKKKNCGLIQSMNQAEVSCAH